VIFAAMVTQIKGRIKLFITTCLLAFEWFVPLMAVHMVCELLAGHAYHPACGPRAHESRGSGVRRRLVFMEAHVLCQRLLQFEALLTALDGTDVVPDVEVNGVVVSERFVGLEGGLTCGPSARKGPLIHVNRSLVFLQISQTLKCLAFASDFRTNDGIHCLVFRTTNDLIVGIAFGEQLLFWFLYSLHSFAGL